MPSSTETLSGQLHTHADMAAMTAELATCVIADLEAALAGRGEALLAVSGGSTFPLNRGTNTLASGWGKSTG